MNTLKFSHDYYKLPKIWDGTQATLFTGKHIYDMTQFKRRFPAFIKYDTAIRTEDPETVKYYPLDFKEGIVLFFIHHNTGLPFTTIRRYTYKKLKYYFENINNTFKLIKTA